MTEGEQELMQEVSKLPTIAKQVRMAILVSGALVLAALALWSAGGNVDPTSADTIPGGLVVGLDLDPSTTPDTDADGDYDSIPGDDAIFERCIDVSVNVPFTIDIFVLRVADLGAFAADFQYDGALIEVTGSQTNLFLDAGPGGVSIDTSAVTPDSDGEYNAGAFDLLGTGTGVTASGVLARLTLNATSAGVSIANLDNRDLGPPPGQDKGVFLRNAALNPIGDGADADNYVDDPFINEQTTIAIDQPDTDSDTFSDGCDFDDDGDGVCDVGGPLPSGTPGAPSGCTLASSGSDNCPLVSNPSQTNADETLASGGATMGGLPITGDANGDACDDDDDNDGWTDADEATLGTTGEDNCTNSSSSGPGPNTDAWAPDMNGDDSVAINDITGPFAPHFGAVQGVAPTGTNPGDYNPRVDLNQDGAIAINDITGKFSPDFGSICT